MNNQDKIIQESAKGMVVYCVGNKCHRKIKDQRIFINGQCLNLCDEHILDFIRKTNVKLSWQTVERTGSQ